MFRLAARDPELPSTLSFAPPDSGQPWLLQGGWPKVQTTQPSSIDTIWLGSSSISKYSTESIRSPLARQSPSGQRPARVMEQSDRVSSVGAGTLAISSA